LSLLLLNCLYATILWLERGDQRSIAGRYTSQLEVLLTYVQLCGP